MPSSATRSVTSTVGPARRKATVREFGTDYDATQDAYRGTEQQANGTDLDVVLLSGDSYASGWVSLDAS
jgi:hypothetical protein